MRIASFRIDEQNSLAVRVAGETNQYHVLLAAGNLTDPGQPVGVALATNELRDLHLPGVGTASARFYRVAAVPIQLPGDQDRDGLDDVYELARGLDPLNPADAQEDPEADGRTRLDEYLLSVGPPTRVETWSPYPGEANVGVNRKTVVRLTQPLKPDLTLTRSNLYAEAGGRAFLSRLELSPDRRTITLFPLEPYPGSARIRVRFDGTGLSDYLGRPLGAPQALEFDTVPLTPVRGTAVTGQVLAESSSRPIPGVLIQIEGAEQAYSVRTDAEGRFWITNAPAGRFFARVDGRTATNGLPPGAYYPFIGKLWEAEALQTNQVNGNGLVFLPLIEPRTLQAVSPNSETRIAFPTTVVASRPELAGVELRVPANALLDASGLRGGRVGIAPVSPDRLPEPLPPGLRFPLVITVQTDGPQEFDRPVPVRFPNLPDPVTRVVLPPGARTALWSFSHDTGQWEIQGSMTVSRDGLYLETDAGVGVRQAGWHGAQSGAQLEMPEQEEDGTEEEPEDPCSLDGEDWWELAMSGYDCIKGTSEALGKLGELLDIYNSLREMRKSAEEIRDEYEAGADVLTLRTRLNRLNVQKDYLMAAYTLLLKEANPVAQATTKFKCASGIIAQVSDKSCKGFDREECEFSDLAFFVCARLTRLTGMVDALAGLIDKARDAGDTLFMDAICSFLDFLIAAVPKGQGDEPRPLRPGARPQAADPVLLQGLDDLLQALEPATAAGDALAGALTQGDATQFQLESLQDTFLNRGLVRSRSLAGAWYRLDVNGETAQAGRLNRSGREVFRIPAEAAYRLEIFDPAQEMLLVSEGRSPRIGQRGDTAPFRLVSLAGAPDVDSDGLAGPAEEVVGTDPARPDSDADGLPDGLEVRQNTNPLDGRAAGLGIIGSLSVPGEAGKIVVEQGLAVVACDPPALAICDVSRPQSPVLLATLPLPSVARDLSLQGQTLAVALGLDGVWILDLARPASPRILQRIPLRGRVDAVNLEPGVVLAVTTLTTDPGQLGRNVVWWIDPVRGYPFRARYGDAAGDFINITDLQRQSGHLVLIDRTGSSYFWTPDFATFALTGSVRFNQNIAPGLAGPPVWIGNGRAYAGFLSGYEVWDASDPRLPRLLGKPGQTQEAVHDLAWDGGPSLLAITSFGGRQTLRLTHYNATNPAVVSQFRASFELPGEPRHLAVSADHAFVGARTGGVQIVRYRLPGTGSTAPAIRWISPLPGSTLPPFEAFDAEIAVESPQRPVEAEFQIDNDPVAVDRQFPFRQRLLAPEAPLTGGTMRLRSRVRLESGSFGPWIEQSIRLGHRTNRLSIDGWLFALSGPQDEPRRLGFYLGSMPLAESFSQHLRLTWFGPDRRQGTADDRIIPLAVESTDPWLRAVFLKPAVPLPYGRHRMQIDSNLRDRSGNRNDFWESPVTFDLDSDLLPYRAKGWRYRVVNAGEGAGFQQGGEPPGFTEGTASFGSITSSCDVGGSVNTYWPSNRDLLARQTVQIPEKVTGLEVRLAFDNGVQVWFDGVELTQGMRLRSGCPQADSLILPIPPALAQPGPHLLAVRARDTGGTSFFDARVTAWAVP